MTDVMTKEQRSRCMSRIRGKHTKPELRLRKALWSTGMRYRLHKRLPGRPDVVFPGAHVAVFVDGCFWHDCAAHGARPKANAEFWRMKIEANAKRDRLVSERLRALGWTVLRFWEHEVNENLDEVVLQIRSCLRRAST